MIMNRIIISAPVSDHMGSIVFNCNSTNTELFSLDRRVSRRATLDGDSIINDYGFTHADRTFTIGAVLKSGEIEVLNHIIQTFASVIISTVAGLFLGSFQSTSVKGSEVHMKILIKEKLA